MEERNEWITKYDGAPNTDIEAVKGGLSDASKRAAVQWGIGRYLYGMESVWVDVEQRGKTVCIKKGQQKKLDDAHEKAVAQMRTGQGSSPPPPATKPVNPKVPDKPVNPPIGSGDNVTPLFPQGYTVTAAKTTNSGSGPSTTLELTDPQGNPIHAYLRGTNPALQQGVRLSSLSLIEKIGQYGTYYIVDKYEIAASHAA